LTTESSARAYLKQLRDFVAALSRIPDYPAGTFSSVEIAQVSSTCERVITQIEQRIEAGDDPSGVKQQLAEAIYDVRREMEEVARWGRHFLQS
jgi:chorismate mutase